MRPCQDRVPESAETRSKTLGEGHCSPVAVFRAALGAEWTPGPIRDPEGAPTAQAQVVALTPARYCRKFSSLRRAVQAAVSREESCQRQPLGIREHWHCRDECSGRVVVG